MAKWVTRCDIHGKNVSEPVRCLNPGSIIAEPGYRSVEEYVALLVTPEETCVGESLKRPILRNGTFVGYIEISDDRVGGN